MESNLWLISTLSTRSWHEYIQSVPKHLQGWWPQQPGQFIPMFSNLFIKKFLLMSGLNLPWHSLRLFPLVLSLIAWENWCLSQYCSWFQVLIWIVQELPLAYFLFSFNSVSLGVMGIKLCFTTPTLTLSQLVMKIKIKILTTARTLALPILNQNVEWESSFPGS